MKNQMIELEDGCYLSSTEIEIVSIPHTTVLNADIEDAHSRINALFFELSNNLYYLSNDENTVAEVIWIAEPVQNQSHPARLRCYVVLRRMGINADAVKHELQTLKDSFVNMLTSHSFAVNTQTSDFDKIIAIVNTQRVNAIVKREKLSINPTALFPYYSVDIFNGNRMFFGELLNTLCNQPNSAVSFQIIPTGYEPEEIIAYTQMQSNLCQVQSGIHLNQGEFYRDPMAAKPLQAYNYYVENMNGALFKFNILIFGSYTSCANLTAKTISSLQCNNASGTLDLDYVDISNENIDLARDFAFYPWNISYQLINTYRNAELWQSLSEYSGIFRMPCVITAKEATSFFKLPIDNGSIEGINVNKTVKSNELFNDDVLSDKGIKFGALTTNPNVVIGSGLKAFTRHALIVGTPGTGKTTFLLNLLLQLYEKGIPFLAIEPTKTEYRALIDAIPDLQVFTPGNSAVSPFIINPFIPPKHIKIEQYIPSLASAFKAAFSMPSPLDMIFLSAIRKCYSEYGWKSNSKFGDTDVRSFGMYEFILIFKKLIDNTDYSKDVRGNIQSGGTLRLMNLIEQNSNIYDSINTIPLEDILSKPTVLELNSIDNAEQKSLIMALLLINICVYTKHNQIGDGELKNAILIDEAHVLLGGKGSVSADSADSQGSTIKALQDMIAEIRSYGTSIIIADQSPSKVSREIVANTDIKLSFRLVQNEEKKIIADSSNMDDNQRSHLSRLSTGEAFFYYSKLENPQLIKTPDIRDIKGIRLSVSDDEVAKRSQYWSTRKRLLRPFVECAFCSTCKNDCVFSVRATADYYAEKIFGEFSGKITTKEHLIKYMITLHELVIFYERANPDKQQLKRLCNCSKIQFIRKFLLNKSLPVTKDEIKRIVYNSLI